MWYESACPDTGMQVHAQVPKCVTMHSSGCMSGPNSLFSSAIYSAIYTDTMKVGQRHGRMWRANSAAGAVDDAGAWIALAINDEKICFQPTRAQWTDD
jgi:hypothetical protein